MKLNLAVFKLTSCSGCLNQLLVTLLSNDDVREAFKIVFMEELGVVYDTQYDVAFVEGSVSNHKQVEALVNVRSRTRFLVGLGTCAVEGGVQPIDEYGLDINRLKDERGLKPLREFVSIDYVIPGCPVTEDQLLKFLRKLALGGYPTVLYENVCSECKRRGVECIVVTRRAPCLGFATIGGCGALCPTIGKGCYGCSGLRIHDISLDKLRNTILRFSSIGLNAGGVVTLLRVFSSTSLRNLIKAT